MVTIVLKPSRMQVGSSSTALAAQAPEESESPPSLRAKIFNFDQFLDSWPLHITSTSSKVHYEIKSPSTEDLAGHANNLLRVPTADACAAGLAGRAPPTHSGLL